jgi:hypothetical protein
MRGKGRKNKQYLVSETQFPLSHRSGQQLKTYVKPEAAITVSELPMMGDVLPETC